MDEYRFSNALNYTHEQLSQMHNASFQGYFVPMNMTAEMSADFWRIHQIDANCSVIMHDQENTFVGLARMGTRGKRGWCGGFGITPQFRGSGASMLLAQQMVHVAGSNGLEQLQLEVLTQNVRAIKLYEKTGFTTSRQLFGVEIATANLTQGTPLPVATSTIDDVLPLLKNAERPFWGSEPASLLTIRADALVLAGKAGGLLVQHANEYLRIVAAAYPDELTDRELATLLRQIAGEAQTIQIFNEPGSSSALARYLRLGFTEFFSQHEMFLKL